MPGPGGGDLYGVPSSPPKRVIQVMARTLLPDDSGENDGLSGRRSPLAQTPKRLPVSASDGLSGRPKERSGERLSQGKSGLGVGRTLRRRSPEPTRGEGAAQKSKRHNRYERQDPCHREDWNDR